MDKNNFIEEKAKEWFSKADNDLRSAEIIIKDNNPPTDTICFHCQQAVGKYLKGFLTLKGIEFMKSHDLDYLLKLCRDNNSKYDLYKEKILTLNKYRIEPRYPADIPICYSIEEANRAIDIAAEIINFIKIITE
jgi:HEPN domain-containing protein